MQQIAIFDMDGTLIDSGNDITDSINYVRSRLYSLGPLAVREVVDAINASSANLAELFYETPLYDAEAKALFEEHYHEQCLRTLRAYEGIDTALEMLRQEGFKMGVATNAPSVFARRMLSHLKLDTYFDLILGADNVEHPKPHPQMILRHLEHHRYRHGTDRAWMIGDNAKDMSAAAQAGINAVFAEWGFAREGIGECRAASPAELLRLICTKE